MSRLQMFLVAGVNGPSKSTLTKTILKKHPTLKVIDPDAIAKGITGSFSTIDSKALKAGKIAVQSVQECISNKYSFIVESTISGRAYLKYLQQAKEKRFKCILVYVALSSPEMSASRVIYRVAAGGHNIPLQDSKRRYPKSFQNLKAHIQLCDLTYLYDNCERYKLVASYRNGLIHKKSIEYSFIDSHL